MTKSGILALLSALTALLAGSGALAKAEFSVPPAERSIIKNVRLLPMTGDNEVLEGLAVLVEGGVIKKIAPIEELGDVGLVIDGDGGFLAPGYIDAHIHGWGADYYLNYLAHGVTTALTLGDRGKNLPSLMTAKRKIAAGEKAGPDLYTTGRTIGSQINIETPMAARKHVRRLKKDGHSFVKTYDGVSREIFDATVAEAARRDMSVFGHISGEFPVEHSLENGLDVIAHAEELYFDYFDGTGDDDLDAFDGLTRPAPDKAQRAIDLMVESDVALIPNLSFTFAAAKLWDNQNEVLSGPEIEYLHPELIAGDWNDGHITRRNKPGKRIFRGRIKYDFIHDLTLRAHNSGVLIVTGTDAPLPGLHPGLSLHSEMRELVKAGLHHNAAFAAATRNGGDFVAKYADKDAKIGAIKVGYEADFVLLADNPLSDIRHAAAIKGVMSNGRWYARALLDEMRTERAAFYKQVKDVAGEIGEAVMRGDGADTILGRLQEAHMTEDPETQEYMRRSMHRRAVDAYRNGDNDELLRISIIITETFPSLPRGWQLLGDAYSVMEQSDKALEAYTRALEADPDFSDARARIEEIKAETSD